MESTFGMIKPDAIGNGYTGKIIDRILAAGFEIKTMKKTRMTRAEAENFYDVHKERPFFNDLVEFITSGPVVAMVLRKENAIQDFRALIGATDPTEADEGTIRKDLAGSKEKNAVHGSDAPETAEREINFFFADRELL